MSDRFDLVPFEDQHIMTVRDADGVFVVMKPIVEAMGLTWRTQHERISNHPVISEGIRLSLIPSAGGMQEMMALHLEQFHGWLVTLDPRRVPEEDRRAVIIRYQKRAFRVIFEHFHGPIGQKPAIRSAASYVALQNQTLRLIRQLQTVKHRVERQVIHQLLARLCDDLGVDTPALDQLGHDAPEAPDIVRQFWDGIAVLKAAGVDYDHSRTSNVIALNLPEIARQFKAGGVRVAVDMTMKKALRLSEYPRYVSDKAVNSRLTGGSKNCWVFAIDS